MWFRLRSIFLKRRLHYVQVKGDGWSFPLEWSKTSCKVPKSTRNEKPVYGSQTLSEVKGYCDADWEGDKNTRKSITGIVFTIGRTAFEWKSKLLASSTMGAEYVAMALCTREALWVRKVSTDQNLSLPQGGISISLFNKMALLLANERKQSAKFKHLDVRYHLMQTTFRNNGYS